jgi:hypothetical protein
MNTSIHFMRVLESTFGASTSGIVIVSSDGDILRFLDTSSFEEGESSNYVWDGWDPRPSGNFKEFLSGWRARWEGEEDRDPVIRVFETSLAEVRKYYGDHAVFQLLNSDNPTLPLHGYTECPECGGRSFDKWAGYSDVFESIIHKSECSTCGVLHEYLEHMTQEEFFMGLNMNIWRT